MPRGAAATRGRGLESGAQEVRFVSSLIRENEIGVENRLVADERKSVRSGKSFRRRREKLGIGSFCEVTGTSKLPRRRRDETGMTKS